MAYCEEVYREGHDGSTYRRQKKVMTFQHTDEESIFADHYDYDALHEILDTQHKITNFMTSRADQRLLQILISIYDFAGDPAFTRR